MGQSDSKKIGHHFFLLLREKRNIEELDYSKTVQALVCENKNASLSVEPHSSHPLHLPSFGFSEGFYPLKPLVLFYGRSALLGLGS
jgi:hypothetical protein